MSMYVVFRLRAKGTQENCLKFAEVLYQYGGHSGDPFIAEKTGAPNNCTIEIRGALRSYVSKYMIDMPPYEESLEGISKTLNLAIEVFGSDPCDGDFEYYYYQNGTCVESCNLPSFIRSKDEFEDFEISEEDQKKYDQLDNGGFVLRKEYHPNTEWDEAQEEMLCQFKIEME